MGKVAIAGAALVLVMTGAADAQRVVQPGPGAGYPPPGPVYYPPLPPAPVQPIPAQSVNNGRWGDKVGGRWWGGANAPGGWAAYRAPQRGWRLPGYWVSPRFYVSDWNAYGLRAPRADQYWTRYYDDAVLIDTRGEVIDTIGGVDWDRYDGGYYSAGDTRRAPPPIERYGYREPMPPYYDERVEHRMHDWRPGPGYPPPPQRWTTADGRTTVTVTTGGGAPTVYAPAYGYGGSVTTVTVQTTPVVTTTTTEILEDNVTWTRPVVRRVYKKRVWRPRSKILRRHR